LLLQQPPQTPPSYPSSGQLLKLSTSLNCSFLLDECSKSGVFRWELYLLLKLDFWSKIGCVVLLLALLNLKSPSIICLILIKDFLSPQTTNLKTSYGWTPNPLWYMGNQSQTFLVLYGSNLTQLSTLYCGHCAHNWIGFWWVNWVVRRLKQFSLCLLYLGGFKRTISKGGNLFFQSCGGLCTMSGFILYMPKILLALSLNAISILENLHYWAGTKPNTILT